MLATQEFPLKAPEGCAFVRRIQARSAQVGREYDTEEPATVDTRAVQELAADPFEVRVSMDVVDAVPVEASAVPFEEQRLSSESESSEEEEGWTKGEVEDKLKKQTLKNLRAFASTRRWDLSSARVKTQVVEAMTVPMTEWLGEGNEWPEGLPK